MGKRGDIVWNTTPTVGGGSHPFVGWICYSDGNNWRTVGPVSSL